MKDRHCSQKFRMLATICVCRLHVFAIGLDALMLNSHLNRFQHAVSIHISTKIGYEISCMRCSLVRIKYPITNIRQ